MDLVHWITIIKVFIGVMENSKMNMNFHCICDIDVENAFDLVALAVVRNSHEHQGIKYTKIKLVQNIYLTNISVIRLPQES